MPNPITTPTLSDIERIAAFSNPVIRNLQITQCYHELALVLAERTGQVANWCTFATWASKQAGQTIRKEDLARTLENMLGSEAAAVQAGQDLAAAGQRISKKYGLDEILKFVWKVLEPEAAFDHSSEAVARGNLKVFAEIGREFARFYTTCLEDTAYDGEKITHFCEGLRPGEPPEGQRYLRKAFTNYYQALFEANEKARTELLLLANLQIGFHEQTRLQPEINEALAAPVISPQAFTRNLLKTLHPEWGWLNELIWLILRLLGRLTELDMTIQAYFESAQREAQFVVTEAMMMLEMPHHNRLRLGDDLTASFPPILERLANPDLFALLEQIDPTPDAPRESGAEYWGDLPDRLHFIADMFRCYQASAELFDPPFTPQQVLELKEGRLPTGRL
ncbi:MAG TPA: hypothetical protein VLA49_16915 [Anaerolineales bacterium]|nr:hypothetical protein [Anaerolineales bacterium]